MDIDVAFLPAELEGRDLADQAVVVFDVLRATTSITAALDAGVTEIHIFGDVIAAADAARGFSGNRLLSGEINTLAPAGFDLGNSPRAFNRADHTGRPMLLSTTNGTRAMLAAAGAGALLCGALVNAAAVAEALVALEMNILLLGSGTPTPKTQPPNPTPELNVLLLCAGTQGAVAMEDLIGAGAVIEELHRRNVSSNLISDAARIAHTLFLNCRYNLAQSLRKTAGGRNVIAAGLEADIDFAAQLNSIGVVGRAAGNPPVIRPFTELQAQKKSAGSGPAQKKSAGSGPVGGGNRC